MPCHCRRAKSAVQTNSKRFKRSQCCYKRTESLPRQRTARLGERCRQYNGHLTAASLHGSTGRISRAFGIKRVKNGFNNNQVYTTVNQSLYLTRISFFKHIPRKGLVSMFRNGKLHCKRLACRTDTSGNPAAFIRIGCHKTVGSTTGQQGCTLVQLGNILLQSVIGQ